MFVLDFKLVILLTRLLFLTEISALHFHPVQSTKNHSQMTREVAGLNRELANRMLEENCDDLENCKVGLEEDFSPSTYLTLGLNPLKASPSWPRSEI